MRRHRPRQVAKPGTTLGAITPHAARCAHIVLIRAGDNTLESFAALSKPPLLGTASEADPRCVVNALDGFRAGLACVGRSK